MHQEKLIIQLHLFGQPAVHQKMRAFHSAMQLLDLIDVVLAWRTFRVSLSSIVQKAQVNVEVFHRQALPQAVH